MIIKEKEKKTNTVYGNVQTVGRGCVKTKGEEHTGSLTVHAHKNVHKTDIRGVYSDNLRDRLSLMFEHKKSRIIIWRKERQCCFKLFQL